MNRYTLLLTLVLLALPMVAFPQERLTLEDAIAKALEYNYDIRIARVSAEQAEVNNTAGYAGMLPNINANGSYTAGSANTHIEFADGRVQNVDNALSQGLSGNVQLNWTLFDGGRMFLIKKQLSELEKIGDVQLKAQVQSTISQVIQAYAQIVLLRQQLVAIDTGLILAKVRMELSLANYETGASAKTDYLQARVDYNARQSDSLYQAAALTASFATLNALMGEDADKVYTVDDSMRADLSLQPKDKELLEQMNPVVELARRNAYVSRLNARIARTSHLPVLTLNGGYNYNRTQSQAGFALFNRSSGPSGSLNLGIPIFQGGNIRRVARVASLQAVSDELRYERQNTELGRQYRTAWSNYRMSVEAYRLEEENIKYAKENLYIQKERFSVGIGTTLETREAENSYVQALVRLYTAAYNVKVNETIVRELEGTLVQ
jgi:outer membrane protein